MPKCRQGWVPLEALRQNLVCVSPSAAGATSSPLASTSVFTGPSAVSLCLSGEDTGHWIRTTLLNWIISTKTPFPNKVRRTGCG